jgi:hypothetical protein
MATLLAFAPFANARLDRIDESMIARFVHHRLKQTARPKAKKSKLRLKTVSRATVNRALATLRRALGLAQKWGLIDRVPRIELLDGSITEMWCLSHVHPTTCS